MFSYRPHFLPTSIVLIGAGGTGSRLLPPLAQLVKTCLRKHTPGAMLENCDIYVVDGDIVEDKNLSRQNFIAPDVGRNKALVVAERYARAFGINIIPCQHFLKPGMANTFEGPAGPVTLASMFANAVVIFAVDSAKARKDILGLMNKYCSSNLFVIDAGNEDDFGQIKTFTGHYLRNDLGDINQTLKGLPKDLPSEISVNFIPFDFGYYQNLGESAQERSCADLPQTLAINTAMATLILCTLQNFMQLRPMTYDGQSFSLAGGISTSWNTPRSWGLRVVDGYIERAEVKAFLGARPESIIRAGTALTRPVSEEGDIFYRLRQQAIEDFHRAGMILRDDGSLVSIAPPEVKLVPKPRAVEAPEAATALPEAPMLIRVPVRELEIPAEPAPEVDPPIEIEDLFADVVEEVAEADTISPF